MVSNEVNNEDLLEHVPAVLSRLSFETAVEGMIHSRRRAGDGSDTCPVHVRDGSGTCPVHVRDGLDTGQRRARGGPDMGQTFLSPLCCL